MSHWKATGKRIAGPARGAPVVHVHSPALRLEEIHFANTAAGSDFRYLYRAGDTHPMLPGKDLHWWGLGAKITASEWVRGRDADRNAAACFTRNRPLAMRARLLLPAPPAAAVSGTLTATPALDGDTSILSPASVSFTYPAGAAELWITVALGGNMPDEVGRFRFDLRWTATGAGFTFARTDTQHYIYAAYGAPFTPDHDSAADGDPGVHTTFAVGTQTGTRKRMDQLTALLGRSRRHPSATTADVIDLLWKLHVGINDTPGAAPFFDGGHTEHLTDNGDAEPPYGAGHALPLEDQWLAWIPTSSPHWNDASCIGHVQILKTMAAAVGLFARRTWIFPTTTRMPDGTTRVLADTDLYCLGDYDEGKLQKWPCTFNGVTYQASPKLVEPGASWENFEACLRSPNGRFLPGGYTTSSCPHSFVTGKGFASAAELLRWWSTTTRPHFGQRFMAWAYQNDVTNEVHFWDVDGHHYDATNYTQIRERHKQLPPP